MVLLALLLFLNLSHVVSAQTNVYGNKLQPCSQEGMALTGWTRSGFCVDQNDDGGSHHICLDISSTSGGNFCEVTGQIDWCSSEMVCVGGNDSTNSGYYGEESKLCPVQQWCVCQWAFASYVQNADGCDKIQDIVCDAINVEAIKAYRQSNQQKHKNALQCIVDQCHIQITGHQWFSYINGGENSHVRTLSIAVASVGMLIAAISYYYVSRRHNHHRWNGTRNDSDLNQTLTGGFV